ncbi:MAG TPA: LURP-one-related family protein [Thermomicrobiales bacterium]
MFRRGRMGAGAAAPAAPVAAMAAARGNRYRMVEKLASFGDDFWIQDDQGRRVFKVDGKALRVRDTLKFRNMQGQELCQIQEKMLRIKDSMEVQGPDGRTVAMVKKALINPLRDRYVVKVGNGPDLEVQGNILDHEYRIGNVATVSKKWFRVRDSYGIEIAPGQNDVLILATAVCIDQMSHDVG